MLRNLATAVRNSPPHDYTATMAFNYFSVVYGIEAVLPGMLARGADASRPSPASGATGRRWWPCRTRASKAAVIHFIEGLRLRSNRAASRSRGEPRFVRRR